MAVTAIAGTLAAAAGRGWAGTVWVILAIGAGQLAVGWSNDFLDRRLDRRQGRLDKPLVTGEVSGRQVAAAAGIALAACVPLSFASGAPAGAAHLVALGFALAYNAGLKTRPLSFVPYAVAFGLLPSVITLGLAPPRWAAPWATAAAAVLGLAGHLTQVLPDIGADRRLGIRGLPQLLGESTSAIAAPILLALAASVVALGPGKPSSLAWAGLAAELTLVLAVLLAASTGRLRTGFRLTLVAAAVTVAIFVAGGRAI